MPPKLTTTGEQPGGTIKTTRRSRKSKSMPPPSTNSSEIPKRSRWRARQVVFTVFEDSNPEWTPESLKDEEKIRYAVGQWELTKDKKKHFQGYAQFYKQQTSRKAVLKVLGFNGHVENARGTLAQNQAYVSKTDLEDKGNRLEGTAVFETGTPTQADEQGKGSQRHDLEEMRKLVLKGATELELADNHFSTWCRNYRALQKYKTLYEAEQALDFRQVTVKVRWGEAGSGKSKKCLGEAIKNGGGYYRPVINSNGQLWFSGYQNEKNLILDDFYGQVKPSVMLRLLDGYKLELETKGGHKWAHWDTVFITSNVHPDNWWNRFNKIPDEVRKAFWRRIPDIEEVLRPDGEKLTGWAKQKTTQFINNEWVILPNLNSMQRSKPPGQGPTFDGPTDTEGFGAGYTSYVPTMEYGPQR